MEEAGHVKANLQAGTMQMGHGQVIDDGDVALNMESFAASASTIAISSLPLLPTTGVDVSPPPEGHFFSCWHGRSIGVVRRLLWELKSTIASSLLYRSCYAVHQHCEPPSSKTTARSRHLASIIFANTSSATRNVKTSGTRWTHSNE